MWHIGAIVNMMNKNLQKISFKNSFIWKMCFLTKKFQIVFNPKQRHGFVIWLGHKWNFSQKGNFFHKCHEHHFHTTNGIHFYGCLSMIHS